MEPSLISALPNLSIGVVSVVSLVYVTFRFLVELKEREAAMRGLEKEVRLSIMDQLTKNTTLMQRVVDHLKL